MSQTAKELGINAEMLRCWVRQFGAWGEKRISPAEHSGLIRLRRELKRVTEERDTPKKQ